MAADHFVFSRIARSSFAASWSFSRPSASLARMRSSSEMTRQRRPKSSTSAACALGLCDRAWMSRHAGAIAPPNAGRNFRFGQRRKQGGPATPLALTGPHCYCICGAAATEIGLPAASVGAPA